jgi:hypothetical protein
MASAVVITAPVGVSALIGAFCFIKFLLYVTPLRKSTRKCLAFRDGVTYHGGMSRKRLPPEVLEFFKKQGARGGKKGGTARAANMTPEERSESARKAVQARWARIKSA